MKKMKKMDAFEKEATKPKKITKQAVKKRIKDEYVDKKVGAKMGNIKNTSVSNSPKEIKSKRGK